MERHITETKRGGMLAVAQIGKRVRRGFQNKRIPSPCHMLEKRPCYVYVDIDNKKSSGRNGT